MFTFCHKLVIKHIQKLLNVSSKLIALLVTIQRFPVIIVTSNCILCTVQTKLKLLHVYRT